MTGFAAGRGDAAPFSWAWDIRSVNARGLDIRLRLPDWVEGLDAAVRGAIQGAVARGNVTVGLKVMREAQAGLDALDPAGLDRALAQLAEVQAAAATAGVALTAPTAAEVLGLRGVTAPEAATEVPQTLAPAILDSFAPVLAAFAEMRAAEGAALHTVLGGQLDEITRLTAEAAEQAEARRDQIATRLKDNLTRVMESADAADPDRVAQELALIAVKADVTEEIDRLGAHVAAARDLLAAEGPVGRKLDFLTQEFNREANTLCAKAQSSALTRTGLDLKAVIDQMREQVQNVE